MQRPVGESAPTFLDEKLSPYHLQQAAVDDILADYDNRDEYSEKLEKMLKAHYEVIGMKGAFPERADMLVTRKVRNVGQVVMKALCDEELMRRIAPQLSSPRSLSIPYDSFGTLYEEGAGQRQVGKYDAFMQTMSALYLGATAAFFYRQTEDGKYDGLGEMLENQERAYRDAWNLYCHAAQKRGIKRLNPPFEPLGGLDKAVFGAIGNNVLTVQSELLAHQRNRDTWATFPGDEDYAAYMRRTALAHAAFLLLPASTNRNTTAQILPDPDAVILEEEGAAVCEDPLMQTSAPHAIITTEDGTTYWDYASLKEGKPWRVPGNCVGDVSHFPTPGNEDVVRRFFEELSRFAGEAEVGLDQNGRFSSILVMHGIGALVAEQTLWIK